MGTASSCTKCSQVAGHIQKISKLFEGVISSCQLFFNCAAAFHLKTIVIIMLTCYQYANKILDYTLREISGACVDTKLRGIEATWVVSGDRGRARTN